MCHAVRYEALTDDAMFWWDGKLYQKVDHQWARRPSSGHRYCFWPGNLVKPLPLDGAMPPTELAPAGGEAAELHSTV